MMPERFVCGTQAGEHKYVACGLVNATGSELGGHTNRPANCLPDCLFLQQIAHFVVCKT